MELWQSNKYAPETLPFCVLHQGHCLTYTYSTFCWLLCMPFWSSPHFSQPECKRQSSIKFREVGEVTIKSFLPNVPFWSPWKHLKTKDFVMFSGGSKENIGKKRVKTNKFSNFLLIPLNAKSTSQRHQSTMRFANQLIRFSMVWTLALKWLRYIERFSEALIVSVNTSVSNFLLTHFTRMCHFYTPWNSRKLEIFWRFQGV